MTFIQSAIVTDTQIAIKFSKTILTSTLVDSAFALYVHAATPVSVPFESIDVIEDYNSISRVLTLTFKAVLEASSDYQLRISGLKDASGAVLLDENYDFTTGATVPSSVLPPAPDIVEIVDKSIRSNAFTTETIFVSNPNFYIIDTDPENFDLFLDSGYNSGRISITFSIAPDDIFISPLYFKAQRKLISKEPGRWEKVTTIVSIDATDPIVYIDFPSDDATPVYTTPGKSYFTAGYKYRIRISKDVGV